MASNVSLVLLLLICGLASIEGCACPDGFVEFEDSCYYFSSEATNYDDASKNCRERGAGLAVISCEAENNFLKGEANKGQAAQYYLGATDLAKEGEWRWRGGALMIFKSWGPGEPNNVNGGEGCLTLMKKWSYNWNDEKCSNSFNYVCEYRP